MLVIYKYVMSYISLQTFKVSILKPVGEAVKIERKKNVINVTLLYGGWGAEVIVTLLILCLEWPNSSRNVMKNVPLLRG